MPTPLPVPAGAIAAVIWQRAMGGSGLKREMRGRRGSIANRGCLALIVLFSLVFIIGFAKLAADAGPGQTPDTRASAAPIVTVDKRLLPALNVDIQFRDGDADAGTIESVGRELGAFARRIAFDRKVQSATFANIMVWDRSGRIMHMTVDLPKLIPIASKGEAPSTILATVRELGFNDIRGERAARDWCEGKQNVFCDQIP